MTAKTTMMWHMGSVAAGAVAGLSFAATNTVDMYALFDQMKTVYGDIVKLIAMLTPIATVAGAAYRTYNMKNVPANSVAVVPLPGNPPPAAVKLDDQHVVIPMPGTQGLQTVGKVVGALLLAAVLSCLLAAPSYAQVRKPQFTGNLIKDVVANSSAGLGVLSPGEILNGIGKISLPDLQYAQAQARAAGNRITEPCWSAWVNLIQTAQQAQKDDKGNEIARPDPHLFTDIESASEMLQALQPGGSIQIGCGPMSDAIKKSVAQIASAIVTGGSALTTLVPVIP